MSALEDRGLAQLSAPSLDERKVMSDAGLLGVHMFISGLGLLVLSEHRDAGVVLMKIGSVLGVSMYGARMLA